MYRVDINAEVYMRRIFALSFATLVAALSPAHVHAGEIEVGGAGSQSHLPALLTDDAFREQKKSLLAMTVAHIDQLQGLPRASGCCGSVGRGSPPPSGR